MATDTEREKRRLILRAAITVFARSGYHTSRVSDVAKEAGVAYGLVYHYFGSKEDLLETIFRRTWSRMLEAVEELEQSDTPAREQLAGVARIVLGPGRSTPTSSACSSARWRARRSSAARSTRSPTRSQALERIVIQGQERGELRAGSSRASPTTAGATPPATRTITARSSTPTRPAPSGCGAPTASTTSSSKLGYNDDPVVRSASGLRHLPPLRQPELRADARVALRWRRRT